MTTIRGKGEPFEVGTTPDVTYSQHSQTVIIKSGGYHKGVEFKVWGRLSPECTRNFSKGRR